MITAAQALAQKPSRFTRLADVPVESYEDAFLISDLLTSRITYLTGEPKAGKSLLAAGMIRALLEGHETFLGQRIHKRLDSVVYGFTDDGADSELSSRLMGTEAFDRLYVHPMFAAGPTQWDELTEFLRQERPGLFVVDTMLGSLPHGQDIGSSDTAQRFVEHTRAVAKLGIPVLVVTHSPKGNAEGLTTPSSVMGGRGLAAGGRGVIALRKNRDGLHLDTAINRANEDLDLKVSVEREFPDREVPRWSVLGARSRETVIDWREELVQAILDEQPDQKTANAVAAVYAVRFDKSRDRTRRVVSDRLTHDGGWTLKTAVQAAA